MTTRSNVRSVINVICSSGEPRTARPALPTPHVMRVADADGILNLFKHMLAIRSRLAGVLASLTQTRQV